MKRSAILLEDAGYIWVAYVLDLPGCVVTEDTEAEEGLLIRVAIEWTWKK